MPYHLRRNPGSNVPKVQKGSPAARSHGTQGSESATSETSGAAWIPLSLARQVAGP